MDIEDIYKIYRASKSISTDTRSIKKGDLFFALKGENFNGNQYANKAIKNGALYAIIDEKEYAENDKYILVDNVLECLQRLANYHRNQFEIPVIGITGSNGKTTTKELIHAALSQSYEVHYTKGNLNNHIGVPLTLLAMPISTQIAIIEMGANHLGEIELLSNIANPNFAIITNCGKAHIEGFGSQENIKKGKGELFEHIKQNKGMAFVNESIDYLLNMSENLNRHLYDNLIVNHSNPFLNLKAEETDFNLNLVGRYNIPNISAAYAIARYFKVEHNTIINGLTNYTPKGLNRSEFKSFKGGNVIMDAYNANPSSMLAAIDSFSKENYNAKMVILGDMFELGDQSDKEHQQILIKLSELDFDYKVVVGEMFSKNNCDTNISCFDNTTDLKKWFKNFDMEQITILIKGSRGMRLETLLD